MNTRSCKNLDTAFTRLHKIFSSFKGQCTRMFNKLPPEVRELPLEKFKLVVKQNLCSKGYGLDLETNRTTYGIKEVYSDSD